MTLPAPEFPLYTEAPDSAHSLLRLTTHKDLHGCQTIPWCSPTSWNGWIRRPNGLEFAPAGIAPVRFPWVEVSNTLVAQAGYNWMVQHSTFATHKILQGFERAVKATTRVRM